MELAAYLDLWSPKPPLEDYLWELLLTLPFSSLILWLPTIPQCSNVSLVHYQGLNDYYHCPFALLLLNWPCINDGWIVSQMRVCSLLMFSRRYTADLLLEQLITVVCPFFLVAHSLYLLNWKLHSQQVYTSKSEANPCGHKRSR